MPRHTLPLDDELLTAKDAAAILKMHVDAWSNRAKPDEPPSLRHGLRRPRVGAQSRGVYRWLRSAMIEHIHRELPAVRTAPWLAGRATPTHTPPWSAAPCELTPQATEPEVRPAVVRHRQRARLPHLATLTRLRAALRRER